MTEKKYKQFDYTERGNTLLTDEDGCTVMCALIEGGVYQLIEHISESKPSFKSRICNLTEEQMTEKLMKDYPYWKVLNTNFKGLKLDRYRCIVGEETDDGT